MELTLADLGFTPDDLDRLQAAVQQPEEHAIAREWLRSFYNTKSPTHFYDAPLNKSTGYEG